MYLTSNDLNLYPVRREGEIFRACGNGVVFLGDGGRWFTHLYAIWSKNENLKGNCPILPNETHTWTFLAKVNSLNNFTKNGIRSGVWWFSYFSLHYNSDLFGKFVAYCKVLQIEIKLLINFSFVISDLLKVVYQDNGVSYDFF